MFLDSALYRSLSKNKISSFGKLRRYFEIRFAKKNIIKWVRQIVSWNETPAKI